MQFLSVFAVVLAFDEIKDYLSLYLYAISLTFLARKQRNMNFNVAFKKNLGISLYIVKEFL